MSKFALDTSDTKARLPCGIPNRVPDRETQFLEDYRDCYLMDVEEVYSAYGDTVRLMKKQKVAKRKHDTSGGITSADPRGKFGGRRHTIPQPVQPTLTAPEEGRPDTGHPEIDIPAIVIINPDDTQKTQYGIVDADTSIVHISQLWLTENSVIIDRAEDLIEYRGNKFDISRLNPGGNFLDVNAEIVLLIRSTH